MKLECFLKSYRLPATAPSFFPRASSSSTPAQTPFAKSVSPTYFRTPGFDPLTKTRSPIFSPGLTPAEDEEGDGEVWWRLVVEVGGEALCRLEEEPEGALLPPNPSLGVVGLAVGDVTADPYADTPFVAGAWKNERTNHFPQKILETKENSNSIKVFAANYSLSLSLPLTGSILDLSVSLIQSLSHTHIYVDLILNSYSIPSSAIGWKN